MTPKTTTVGTLTEIIILTCQLEYQIAPRFMFLIFSRDFCRLGSGIRVEKSSRAAEKLTLHGLSARSPKPPKFSDSLLRLSKSVMSSHPARWLRKEPPLAQSAGNTRVAPGCFRHPKCWVDLIAVTQNKLKFCTNSKWTYPESRTTAMSRYLLLNDISSSPGGKRTNTFWRGSC